MFTLPQYYYPDGAIFTSVRAFSFERERERERIALKLRKYLITLGDNLRGTTREMSAVHKVLVVKETDLEAVPLLILIEEELRQQQQRDIAGEWLRDIGFRCLALYN